MRLVERVHRRILTVNKIQFDFMPERGTIGAVLILRRIQRVSC